MRHAQLQYHTNIIDAIVKGRLAAHIEKLDASQAEAIDAAVNKRLDTYFGGPLHAETVYAAVDKQVDRQVDAAVKARLPIAVQDFLVPKDPPSSPAHSFTSFDSHGNRYPKLPPLTPAGKALLPHLKTHLTAQFKLYQDQQLQRFEQMLDAKYDDVARSAEDDRIREQGEWEEERVEHTAEVLLIRKDTTDDLWREGHEMLKQGQELCEQFGADINEQLFGLVEAINKLNRYSLRKLMTAEVAKLTEQQRKKKSIPKGFGRNLSTLPDPKLLMSKVTDDETEDEEWEDI